MYGMSRSAAKGWGPCSIRWQIQKLAVHSMA